MIEAATLALGLIAGGFWILTVIAVILAIFALISVFRNPEFTGGAKLLWVLVILIFPLLGSVIYFAVRSDW